MTKTLSYSEILELEYKRPHVVLLGAGSTTATIPNGDKNGHPCSVMNGFVKNLSLEHILSKVKLLTKSDNIEDIYSELYARGKECQEVIEELENAIFSYFSELELPDEITILDKLILSLTSKDLIASFNWDPFLIQAYNRVGKITKDRPVLAFLHGNVATGFCPKCGRYGAIQRLTCDNPTCLSPLQKSHLLYPIKNKDYHLDTVIEKGWELTKNYLSRAKILTIFGYSAPISDVEAVSLLKNALLEYHSAQKYNLIEIIERPGFCKSELSNSWRNIIESVNCDYRIEDSFYKSHLSAMPRQTVQSWVNSNGWGSDKVSFLEKDDWDAIYKKVAYDDILAQKYVDEISDLRKKEK